MSMTKMDCTRSYVSDSITLDGCLRVDDAESILDALHIGNEALDILSRLDLDMSTWEGRRAKEILEEWNS